MCKLNWKYGENDYQKYYEAYINGLYLIVFCNKWSPDIWMADVDGKMIFDKTSNDRCRKKYNLPKDAPIFELRTQTLLCNKDPAYMMKKAEYCYSHNIIEIGR